MSYRSAQFGLVPRYGVPHYFASWKDFCRYVEVMRDCQAIHNTKDIHWDIRSRPQSGTVEFRVCDMPARLSQVFAIVALVRCLVVGAQRLLEEKPNLRQGDLRRYWIVPENKWLAARYGLQAQCIRTPGGKRQTLQAEVAGLVERIIPIAEEFGDAPFLAVLQDLEHYETGAQRQRRIYRDAGNWKAVVDDMRARLVQELEEATVQDGAIGAAL
jgi:carboxylate-amine ligase